MCGPFPSGPAALCTFNSCNSFNTSDSDIWMSGMFGKGEIDGSKSCDTGLSFVNTDWNCIFNAFASLSGVDTLFPVPSFNELIPEVSDRQCLMKVHNLFIPGFSLLSSLMGVMMDST